MKIFNSLGRKLEDFNTILEGKVKFYHCGPTVYSRQHIGNMRAAVLGDLIRKSLEFLGFQVLYTKNITDVGHLVSDEDEGEDKMAKGAKKEGISPEEIALKYTEIYRDDLKKLNVKDPTYETIASEYVNEMATMVQELLDKGFAYKREKAIYFEVAKFPEYTKLSGQKLDMNQIGAGHGDINDEDKKSPYDFAVWFFKTGSHKNALQTWKHKFSGIAQEIEEGFPGWHIECSAMAKDTLGNTLDIHMGGVEHIPVHHTNEIAQSEAANGAKYVNYWLHNEMLDVDGVKMSKSIGNVFSLDDIISRGYMPLAFRYFLLQAHYRSKQNFTWEAIEAASRAYEKLLNIVAKLKNENSEAITSENEEVDLAVDYFEKFKEALEDDFNLPKALSVLWELVKSEDIKGSVKLKTIFEFDKVLDLSLSSAESRDEQYSDEVKMLIEERQKARDNKDWETADKIRDLLKSKFNIKLEDK